MPLMVILSHADPDWKIPDETDRYHLAGSRRNPSSRHWGLSMDTKLHVQAPSTTAPTPFGQRRPSIFPSREDQDMVTFGSH